MMIALYFADLVGLVAADQYKVAIPPFRLTLHPVDSDFSRKAAKKVFEVAAGYLTDRLDYGGVSSDGNNDNVRVEEVTLDYRSWSFRDKIRQRRRRSLRRRYVHDDDTDDAHRREAECTVCSDKQTVNMVRRGITCPNAKEAVGKRCREDDYWVANRACEYSCWLEGRGYTDIKECCDPNFSSKEVVIKSEQPIGGYVIFTADSPQSLPDQAELLSRFSSSLFPGDTSGDIVEDNGKGGLAEALAEQLGYSNNVGGTFYSADPPKEGVSGLITESPTSLSPTIVWTAKAPSLLPTNTPALPPTLLSTDKPMTQPVMQFTPTPTHAPATAAPTFSPSTPPTFSLSASPITPKPVKAPNTIKPTPFPSKSPTRIPSTSPTPDDNDISEDLGNPRDHEEEEDDEGDDEHNTPLTSGTIAKASDQGNDPSSNNTALMAGAVVASFTILLLGAFYMRRRRYRKEYDTAANGGCDNGRISPSTTNINGDKSCQLRNFDALYAIDEDPLEEYLEEHNDGEDGTCLDLSIDSDDIVADLVGCGADLSIQTKTPIKTKQPINLGVFSSEVDEDDNATAPLSPSSPSSLLNALHTSPVAGSTASLGDIIPTDGTTSLIAAVDATEHDEDADAFTDIPSPSAAGDSVLSDRATSALSNIVDAISPAVEDELTMVEPKIVASPVRLATTDSDQKNASKTATAPFLPLDLGRNSSLGKEVDFDAPSFEPPGDWNFHDNDVESTNSSDLTTSSTHDPFVTPDKIRLKDEDSLIQSFPPCSPGSPGRRKAYVQDNSNVDYNYDESSSAASLLFTALGRSVDWRMGKGANSGNVRETNTNKSDQQRSDNACDFDRWSMRDWDETVML